MSDVVALDVTVDVSKMKISDLELIAMFQEDGPGDQSKVVLKNITRLLDMLDRLVVGGARDLPYSALAAVMKAVGEAFSLAANPETPKGN